MGDFFDVPLTKHPTSAGIFELPVLYRDASQFAVNWRVPLEPVRALFAGKSIEPWPLFGKAMVALYVWEYRDSSLGPYGEVGLGILCRRRGTSPSLLKLVFDGNAQDDQGI
jgi:hypothetical protein